MLRSRNEIFDDFFRRATGSPPYAYQRDLAERAPSVVDVPTGCGKTAALICSWLYRVAAGEAPRRLVYALPLRTLVEQTADVAVGIRAALGAEEQVEVHTLVGGGAATEWRESPQKPQILIGTIDMLLSRALNRGYAESRFVWPVSFGLLNNDCRWVFDEVQLMGPARSTSTQLDGLRQKLGTLLPCETVWASATLDREALISVDRPELGPVLSLPDADRTGPLAERLEARKLLRRLDVTGRDAKQSAAAIAEAVLDGHRPGTLSLVVQNTVDRARATVGALLARVKDRNPAPELLLLHSRFRPPERRELIERLLSEPGSGGKVVVSTQVIEAGVDISAALLATETAPFSSVVQRLGRCNRAGELERGEVIWIDAGEDAVTGRLAPPYAPGDLAAARAELLKLEGESLGPAALGAIEVPEQQEDWEVLRRRDLLELFDTSADLSGTDIDVSRFIRPDDERNVPVLFRSLAVPTARIITTSEQADPQREELVSVPIVELAKLVRGGRAAWVHSHLDDGWMRVGSSELAPGRPVLLAAADGGYDGSGWNPESPGFVEPVTVERSVPDRGLRQEATGADPDSTGGWLTLSEHLERVSAEAASLLEAIDLDGGSYAEAVWRAAALHDVGKAHEIFQAALQTVAIEEGREELQSEQLAKSPRRGPGYARPHFRHELASALALNEAFQGSGMLGDAPELIRYLVGAHHGRARMSVLPIPGEARPPSAIVRYALGVWEGDQLPAVRTPLGTVQAPPLQLTCLELGGEDSWSAAALALRDDPALGPFRLGMLEAIVRIADWRGSA